MVWLVGLEVVLEEVYGFFECGFVCGECGVCDVWVVDYLCEYV